MTGDDLKRLQNHFFAGGQQILRENGHLRPIGFVVTLHKHVEKLLKSGWGTEILGDPKATFVRDDSDDRVTTLVLDLLMDWKRLYHAVLKLFPQTRDMLPGMVALAEKVRVDDPYKRVMRPFMAHTKLDEKDVIAATLRHVCNKVDAFACIMQCEAWIREVAPDENIDQIPDSLGDDAKSVEVVYSSMETYDFARMITAPLHRKKASGAQQPQQRDEGAVLGFGTLTEHLDTQEDTNVLVGRFVRFLKPLDLVNAGTTSE